MMPFYDNCATQVPDCEPTKVVMPGLTEVVRKCGDCLADCQAMANGILSVINGAGPEVQNKRKDPMCLSEEALINVDRAKDLMETLARIQAAIG